MNANFSVTTWRLAGAAFVGLILVACGKGSGAPGPEEASGIFQAGGISGVHYATPTRSGTTDAAGTFKYLPGETVTFSIGAIERSEPYGATTVFTNTEFSDGVLLLAQEYLSTGGVMTDVS